MGNSEDGHLQSPSQAIAEHVPFTTIKDVSAFADLTVREWTRWCVSGLHRVYCLRGGRHGGWDSRRGERKKLVEPWERKDKKGTRSSPESLLCNGAKVGESCGGRQLMFGCSTPREMTKMEKVEGSLEKLQ